MMKKLKWLFVLLTPIMLSWGAHAQRLLEPENQLRGQVEQWTPGARLIKVGGEMYPLSKSIQVMDQNAALLSKTAVRAGMQVQLLIAHGLVTHVVVNPGVGPVMDQIQR